MNDMKMAENRIPYRNSHRHGGPVLTVGASYVMRLFPLFDIDPAWAWGRYDPQLDIPECMQISIEVKFSFPGLSDRWISAGLSELFR